MIIQKAKYQPSAVTMYQNNPLIEALTDYLEWSPAAILEKLSKEPSEINELANRVQSTAWLSSLPSNLFIPTKRHFALFETIDLLIRQGYMLRNPMTPTRAEYLRDAYARQQAGEKLTECTFEEDVEEQLTASLIGTSGMGKTRTVKRILTLYPRLIQHDRETMGGPILQITYIHVECPHDGSVITLCKDILTQIDNLTGLNYKTKFRITDRTTLDTLKSTLVHILAVHYVGIIVIDEIQNLASSRKNREDLFNFIVSLSNSLNVPLLFVGTPKIHKFLTGNMRTARRFGTRGFINWKPLSPETSEWKKLIRGLWKCNRLKHDAEEVPKEIEEKLYEHSFGIVELLLKLFILAQTRVLLVSACKDRPTEQKLTPEAIDYIFNEYFQNVKPILDKLHKGDVEALLKLDDIVMPESIDEVISEIKADLYEDVDSELDPAALRKADVEDSIRSGMEYAGDALPDVAKDIAQSLINHETPMKGEDD